MTNTRLVAAFLLALAALPAATRLEGQGLGGLIKKKAAEAAKGKDNKADQGRTLAKDEGPITSQFEKECGPLTPDALDRFMNGLETEAAARDAFDRKIAGARPDDEVSACRGQESMSPDAMAIIQRGMGGGGSTDQIQKQMEQNRADLETYLTRKCGEPVSKYEFNRYNEYEAARKSGAKAAGVNPNCYDKLKEFALFFCKGMTPAQQTAAAEQGIKVRGHGQGVWVYTAEEATALAAKCGKLVPLIDATGYTL